MVGHGYIVESAEQSKQFTRLSNPLSGQRRVMKITDLICKLQEFLSDGVENVEFMSEYYQTAREPYFYRTDKLDDDGNEYEDDGFERGLRIMV